MTPAGARLKERPAQEPTVGHDHHDIRPRGSNALETHFVVGVRGLHGLEVERSRQVDNRGRARQASPASRSVGLRDDEIDDTPRM